MLELATECRFLVCMHVILCVLLCGSGQWSTVIPLPTQPRPRPRPTAVVPPVSGRHMTFNGSMWIMYDLGRMPSDFLNRNDFETFNITFVTNRPDGLIWFTGNDRENIHLTLKVTHLESLDVNTLYGAEPGQCVGICRILQLYRSSQASAVVDETIKFKQRRKLLLHIRISRVNICSCRK